jgi:hypothetical protein
MFPGVKMKTLLTTKNRNRKGAVLVIAMVFLATFVSLSASMLVMSSANAKIADNQQIAGQAISSAFSGMEIMRYWLEGVTVSGTIAEDLRLSNVSTTLQNELNTAGATTVNVNYNSDNEVLTVSNYTLNSSTGEAFTAVLSYGDDYDTVQIDVTGFSNGIEKTIRNNFWFGAIGSSIFDFGIATKGPLSMTGNVDIDGYNENIEASVYIESMASCVALEMTGKSSIAGEVSIVNPLANADIGRASSVGGETGSDAHEHITIGVGAADFPNPNPEIFESYVQNVFVAGETSTNNATIQNILIPAGTNPSFTGDFNLQGLMYIESPNTVTFAGNAVITGMIVAEGDVFNPSSDNQLSFSGNVETYGVSELPDTASFSELKQETGTFLLAPGFNASFTGNFNTVNGVIAASGISFSGNAGGVINGSVVNYSNDTMTLNGNSDLKFNRSGIQATPSGFGPSKKLEFLPGTYEEVVN